MTSQTICNFCGLVLGANNHFTATVTAPPTMEHPEGQIILIDFGAECRDHTLREVLAQNA